MPLSLERFDDPSTFLGRVGGFLAEREAEHNLLFGILDSLERATTPPDHAPYLAAVADAGRIVVVALRTPPRSLVLSEVDNPAGLGLIVEDIAATGDRQTGVVGSVEAARDFAVRWTARTGQPHRLGLHQRIFKIERVIPPRPTPGSMRLAGPADADLLVAWLTAFSIEALPPEENAPDPAATVAGWLQSGIKRNYLWEVDGRPVSWAGAGGRTPSGTRIGPVYTPPADRGRGYASSVVAASTQAQLDDGLRFCFLFTDLANPTANHVYEAIGYEAVTDVDGYFLG